LFGSLAVGAPMVFLVGLYDDINGAGIWSRLGVEITAALVVVYGGGLTISNIMIPFYGQWHLTYLAVPLTVVWMVGITNALNIIDGLDGLAGGIAFIACFGVFAVATLNGQPMAMVSTALLAGSTLGFLRYNSHPASIFLGDSGALLLGFLLACISVDTSLKRSTSLALILPMQMLAVPLMDTLYSMGRRLWAGVFHAENLSWSAVLSMFRSDKDHIHHKLLDVGFSHPRAVWVLYALSAVVVMFGLTSALVVNDRVSLLFLVGALAAFLIIRHFGESLPFIRRWTKTEQAESFEEYDRKTPPSSFSAEEVDRD
jgi:UDP-GlcNAc:undecaprenyl-phosphate GlcNAc-1-phosphate transferase